MTIDPPSEKFINKWKFKTHHICQTPGMQLFMAIQINARYGVLKGHDYRPRKFDTWAYAINESCKCRNCRYHRWRNSKVE